MCEGDAGARAAHDSNSILRLWELIQNEFRAARYVCVDGICTRGARMWCMLAAGLQEYRMLRHRNRSLRQRRNILNTTQDSVLPFLIDGEEGERSGAEWPAEPMQRTLIIDGVMDLDKCSDALIAGLGYFGEKGSWSC